MTICLSSIISITTTNLRVAIFDVRSGGPPEKRSKMCNFIYEAEIDILFKLSSLEIDQLIIFCLYRLPPTRILITILEDA